MFVNTLTADGECSRQDKENLAQEIQMQFSKKPKIFSQFFIAFLKSTSHFKYFEKRKDEFHSLSISEIVDSKKGG